jgi:hypothetical protein
MKRLSYWNWILGALGGGCFNRRLAAAATESVRRDTIRRKRGANSLVVAISLAVLAAVGVVVTPKRSTAAGSAPVTVTNTPLQVQGTATVSGIVNVGTLPSITGSLGISNVPTVNVGGMPAISGSLGISNSPTVNVGSLPSVSGNLAVLGTPTVTLVSSLNNPIQVQNGATAGAPFVYWQGGAIQDKDYVESGHFFLSNQKLHIEYASFRCNDIPPGQSIQARLFVPWKTVGTGSSLGVVTVPNGLSAALMDQQVSLYSDGSVNPQLGDGDVHFDIERSFTSGQSACFITISGKQVTF